MSKISVTLNKLDPCRWMIPKTGGMRVPGIIYTSEAMLREMGDDQSPQQVMNVA